MIKIIQHALFEEGSIKRPGKASLCAIVEIRGVRFFSLTPNDKEGCQRINDALAQQQSQRWWWPSE
jgi:hypothetical protein